jgi:hypothetical protein
VAIRLILRLVASLQLVAIEGTSKGKPSGTLMLRMEDLTPSLAKSAIDDAQNPVAASKLASANGGDLASRLKVVVTRLDFVLKIGDGVTQVRMPMRGAVYTSIVMGPRSIPTPMRHGRYSPLCARYVTSFWLSTLY